MLLDRGQLVSTVSKLCCQPIGAVGLRGESFLSFLIFMCPLNRQVLHIVHHSTPGDCSQLSHISMLDCLCVWMIVVCNKSGVVESAV